MLPSRTLVFKQKHLKKVRRIFFTVRAINQWNILPLGVVGALWLETFQN